MWKGRSVISGGRKPLRDARYISALATIRFNPDFQAKYSQLRATGKPTTVAIATIIRKLLEAANALVGGVRQMRTSLCLPLDARTYAEQSWRHSERAALRLILKLARE